MVELIFWTSLFLVFYVYAGYPLAVAALGVVRGRRVRKSPLTPKVTVLIAAYNEEAVIAATVRNKLELDYPVELVEVLVISDGSSDLTDQIVTTFNDPRVRLLRQEPRAGKTSALNHAIPHATGEIIVFSDANSLYAPDALRSLIMNFADPEVGYVTGRMIYANPEGSAVGDGCTSYMKYENALRVFETSIGSVIGVDGGIDAIRKILYVPMKVDQLPDFVLPLQVVRQGFRVVYEPMALLREEALKEVGDEYRMRVRVSLRALWAVFDMRQLLFGQGGALFAWQLWSHKVLRYMCFLFLGAALLSNLLLLSAGLLYQVVFALQMLSYFGALATPIFEKAGLGFRLLAFARYFSLLNIACAHAFGKFLLGKKQVLWVPRSG